MAEKSFRIRTDIGKDKVVKLNITQEYDFLEILSLQINQSDTYKLHTSDYGIVVGRVLANDGFGVPNAKVSIFIPLSDEDAKRSDILNIYPYSTIYSKDSNGRRYNLLPDESTDECYKIVGTFPNKRKVLDDAVQLEVFEKYWKYTTVTNNAGDYMIYGVPTGQQQVHVDIDLSDIGVLSQKPIDMQYKGYNATQFENARQFKDGTNLDNLSQIISQNNSVHVYPFWGDSEAGEIAITRCDINVAYKFEPTCVFIGSIITDSFSQAIGHDCNATKYSGYNSKMVSGEGTIEMIRKTPDRLIEEFQIQGNRLIDGDGVWAYQIPMNLDYVATDEFGNIVPTDNPNKGIPTRTSVRFRMSIQETGYEGVGRHRAKYLVPNYITSEIKKTVNEINGVDKTDVAVGQEDIDKSFEFGSATQDMYFRDLFWNKVYSVKNYIPRIQTNEKKNTTNYNAIRSTNLADNVNPAPFNQARFKLSFTYRIICLIMTVLISIIYFINMLMAKLACLGADWKQPCILGLCIGKIIGSLISKLFKAIFCPIFKCISFGDGLNEETEYDIIYVPGCDCDCLSKKACKGKQNCVPNDSMGDLMDVVQQSLAQEFETVHLDFYNDWLNGSLYMPLWFWRKTKKKKFLFGLFSKKAVNQFCNCNKTIKMYTANGCSLQASDYQQNKGDRSHFQFDFTYFGKGVIQEFTNRAGLNVYYYTPALMGGEELRQFYATDIILLGSLNDCDLNSCPSMYQSLPSTTSNQPYIASVEHYYGNGKNDHYPLISGMDWLGSGDDEPAPRYKRGLFFDLACQFVATQPKTCANLSRLSELGVTIDARTNETIPNGSQLTTKEQPLDGMITRFEIQDNEARAAFASLNHHGLYKMIRDENNFLFYDLAFLYPNDFDGKLVNIAPSYTNGQTVDRYDNSYVAFRLGKDFAANNAIVDGRQYHKYRNSFYFYFGLYDGKTAIDKFNERFYATCYKSTKYPFTLDLKRIIPAAWCPQNENTDYGTIEIEFLTIKAPYQYQLLNDVGVVVEEGESTQMNLKFERKFSNGDFITNGEYTIKITDANGNTGTQKILLKQTPMSVTYEYYGLGTKYYKNISGGTIITDICSDWNFYGELKITLITIDNKPYKIIDIKPNTDGTYNLTLEGGNEVQLSLTKTISDEEFEDCTCQGVGGIPTYWLSSDNELYFSIWVPDSYDLVVTQICNGELNDNIFSDSFVINNGEAFNAFYNTMPMTFLLKDTSGSTNNKFYTVNNITEPNQIEGWFMLHKPNAYGFYNVTDNNIAKWRDFVTLNPEVIIEGNTNSDKLTNDDYYNITNYKLNAILRMSMDGYAANNNMQNSISITTNGGKAPILAWAQYPRYDKINEYKCELTTIESTLSMTTIPQYPNIIGGNYGYFNEWLGYVKLGDSSKPIFNPIFNSLKTNSINYLGNYFGVFTNNGYKCTDENKKILTVPNNITNCPFDEEDNNAEAFTPTVIGKRGGHSPYFRGEIVDRRLDYEFVVINPTTNILQTINAEKYHARISGITMNGVEMSFDSATYNIVSNNDNIRLEYNVETTPPEIDGETRITSQKLIYNDYETRTIRPRFYSAIINGKDLNKYFIGNYDLDKYLYYDEDNKDNGDLLINSDNKYANDFVRRYMSNDRKIILPKTMCNGEFDKNNYPTYRFLDYNQIPLKNNFNLNIKTCSYRISSQIVDDRNGNKSIQAQTEDDEELEFIISASDPFTSSYTLADAFNRGYSDVGYSYVSDKRYRAKEARPSFKVKADMANEGTHNITRLNPKIVNLSQGKIIDDFMSYTDTTYRDHGFGFDSIISQYGGANTVISNLPSEWTNDALVGTAWRICRDEEGHPVFEDDSTVRNFVYTSEKLTINGAQYVCALLKRLYTNNGDDLLKRQITAFQFGYLLDTRFVDITIPNNAFVITKEDATIRGTITLSIVADNANYNQSFFKNLDQGEFQCAMKLMILGEGENTFWLMFTSPLEMTNQTLETTENSLTWNFEWTDGNFGTIKSIRSCSIIQFFVQTPLGPVYNFKMPKPNIVIQ